MNKTLPRAPKHEFLPINHCIYCGNVTDELTDEHIIPFGLNGNLVLPKSSCAKCARVTSEIERKVLRGFMENGRRAMGIPSRHKKHKKPPVVPVKFITGDTLLDGEMSIESGFHTIHLPIFSTPLALRGGAEDFTKKGIEIVGIDTLHIGDPIKAAQLYRAEGIQIHTNLDIDSFIRMLAKISYAYYVAEKGAFPLGESPVLPIAIGQDSHVNRWIGCLEEHPLTKPGSEALHLLDITELQGADSSVCSVVRVKLFSTTSGPTYSVVVRIHKPMPFF